MRRSSGNSPEACKPTKRKRWRKDYAVCFLSTFCVFTITYASFHTAYFLPTHFYISLSDQQMTTSELFLPVLPDNLRNKSCSVLSGMTSGTWKTRPLTSKERHEISTFLKDSRDLISTNGDYQRPDLKCGNLTYTGSDYMKWFRVLCNPEGPTPCCFHNRCENRTVEECKGPLNYDLRPRVHAEYSTWVPHDKRCSVKLFVSQSACKLLEGATIYVIGDSLMRQLYTALIMILRGNFKTGALKANTPPGKLDFIKPFPSATHSTSLFLSSSFSYHSYITNHYYYYYYYCYYYHYYYYHKYYISLPRECLRRHAAAVVYLNTSTTTSDPTTG